MQVTLAISIHEPAKLFAVYFLPNNLPKTPSIIGFYRLSSISIFRYTMTSTYIREVYTDIAEKTQERSRELTLLRLLGLLIPVFCPVWFQVNDAVMKMTYIKT